MKTVLNIAKNTKERIEEKKILKNWTQKGFAQAGVVVFEKKKRSDKK